MELKSFLWQLRCLGHLELRFSLHPGLSDFSLYDQSAVGLCSLDPLTLRRV